MLSEERVEAAMQIIMSAGDARVCCQQALSAIAKADFETAKDLLKESQKKITEAHRVQTEAIQGETRGEESEYSLLFTHAQDTLMTIYSEINIAKQMLKIFTAYEERIAALEK